LACGVLLAALGAARPTSAAPSAKDRQRAMALLREGAALLDSKDYAEALGKFTEAYGLVPSPKIQFNVGLAQEGLARPAEATRAFQAYVDGATGDAPARRAEAQGRIVALRSRVALLHISADVAGATVAVDGADEGTTPLPRPLVVAPGAHQVVLEAPGAPPWTRAVRGEAGATVELQANLQPPLAAKAPPAEVKHAPPFALAAPEPHDALSAPLPARGGEGVDEVDGGGRVGRRPEGRPPQAPGEGTSADDAPPLYKRAWFWTTVGGVLVAGAVTTFLLLPRDTKYACQVPPCIGAN
jgi:hypothetical protein